MTYSPILAPVVALAAWSLIMLVWLYAARFPAMRRAGISLKGRVGSRGQQLDGVIEDSAQWKSHNYAHLMEQPTVFYAIAITLALMDMGGGINLWLACGYVGLRVLHSLVQATINIVSVRLLLFTLATLCLIGMTTHAGLRVLHDCFGW